MATGVGSIGGCGQFDHPFETADDAPSSTTRPSDLPWVAGYYGIDRYLLPMLGTPWRARVATGHPIAASPAPS